MLTARPDRRRRPSDGLVIEASILARLLRIRLLTLEATIVVAPADVTTRSAPSVGQERPSARPARALRPARSAGVLPARSAPHDRRGLAAAVQTIDEGAAILAEVRRTASGGRTSRNGGTRG